MSKNAQEYTYVYGSPTPFLVQLIHISLKMDTICQKKIILFNHWNCNEVVLISFSGDVDDENMKF